MNIHQIIEKSQTNICQVVCYKNGTKIYDDTWNGYKNTDACHVMSVTKSVVAILIGIAIDQGIIESIDQKVLDFFPDYVIKRGEKTIQKVTLRHLLTMTAPFKYKYEPWVKVCTSEDWTKTALDFLGGRKGLTNEFRYSTLGIHILAGILTKVSNMKVVDYANKYLFEPLGIAKHYNYFAASAEEHKEFTISHEPKTNVWFADPLGVGTAGYGLCFSAGDLALLGELCLNEGKFNDKQIVSSKWIKDISTSYFDCGKEFRYMGYGYLWWIINKEEHIYAAIGNSGNVIYVNPNQKIVIGITSYFNPRIFDRVDFIENVIIPHLTNIKA